MSNPSYLREPFRNTDPYAGLTALPAFELGSLDFAEGEKLGATFIADGENLSPELHWSNLPEGTKSIAVTMYDPDAPTTSGFWHWGVYNIPATVSGLARGAGQKSDAGIPGAITLFNDAGTQAYYGPQPPQSHGPHRYLFAVWAVKEEKLELPENASLAILGFNLNFKSLGRSVYWGWYETT